MVTQSAGQGTVVSVNPFRCRMWAMHDRLDEYITEESCREEIRSFEKHGQLVTALGRRVTDEPAYDFELIYGARRLFVARHLNQPLKLTVRELSDLEALIAMDVENRHRKEISAYERGRSFARWLRMEYFQSQDDIAHALGISGSQVSRLLKMAKLPAVIIAAFPNPLDIREGWGIELADACEDLHRRTLIMRRARVLATRLPRATAHEIFAALIEPERPARKNRDTRKLDEIVKDSAGKPLFRVRRHRDAVALVLPTRNLSSEVLGDIKQLVAHALQATAHRWPAAVNE